MRGFDRRGFLRGLGTIAIGLPFASHARAATGRAPSRYVSLYFGNGMPKKFVQNGYTGVLEPLAPFADKLAMLRDLRLPESGGGDLHYKGTARFGKGVHANGESSAGGESLDNLAHRTYAPDSLLLNTNIHTAVTGGNPATRWYHSWRGPNQPNDELLRPLAVFDAIFGSFLPPPNPEGPTPEDLRAARYDNSVLDSVMEQYRVLKGPTSPYGAKAKTRIGDHFELVRNLERRALEMEPPPMTTCAVPDAPPDLIPSQDCNAELCPGDDSYYYGSGGTNWNEIWELHAEMFALAIRCGIVRFGTLGCTGGGDRYPVPELREMGITESPHVLAHDWRRDGENGFDLCVKWLMEKVAFFLARLDDPAWAEPDGTTLLDDTLVLIGTELGTGADGQHAVDSMTYWLAGGGGRIASGDYELSGRSDVDLYSTVTRAMELGDHFGDMSDFSGHFDIVR